MIKGIMPKILAILTIFLSPIVVNSQERPQILEHWKCYSTFFNLGNILIEAKRIKLAQREVGRIEASGIIKETNFGIDGFQRKWTWGSNKGSSFKIGVDRKGHYYDYNNYESKTLFCVLLR